MDEVVLAGGEPTAMKSERTRSNNKRGMNLLHSEHYVDAVQTTIGRTSGAVQNSHRLKIEIKSPKKIFYRP
jgi:hypothetical protein